MRMGLSSSVDLTYSRSSNPHREYLSIADFKQLMDQRRFLLICFTVCIAAGSWGLYWIPQRMLEQAGMTGGWGTIAQYVVSVLLLAPLAVRRFFRGQVTGLNLPLAGALMGGGIVCYANSLLLTDVIRTMLLFYMTPLWATIIEIAFLRQRPGWWRLISLPLSLAGVVIVIGKDSGFPMPSNTGDWLAFAGGAIYAAGAARVQLAGLKGVFPILFAFFVYGGIVACIQALLLANHLGAIPDNDAWLSMAPWLILLSLVFFIPSNAVMSWAPTQISTGLFSILILAELIFGTVSAALWANEPFGLKEVLGIAFILSAGILEVTLAPRDR